MDYGSLEHQFAAKRQSAARSVQRLFPEHYERMKAQRDSGLSDVEIAKRWGVSSNAIGRFMRKCEGR